MRGLQMFMSEKNIIGCINMAIHDVLNYNGRNWKFMKFPGVIIRGSSDEDIMQVDLSAHLPDDVYIKGILSMKVNGSEVTPRILNVPTITMESEVYVKPYSREVYLKNIGDSGEYEFAFQLGFKQLKSANSIIPLPEQFFGALFDYTLSYIMLPFGQYGEQKDQTFYERAQQKMKNIIDSSPVDGSFVVPNIH